MSARLRSLLEKRNRIVEEIRTVSDEADKSAEGVLSVEQREKIEQLEKDETNLDASIEAENRQIEREKRTRTLPGKDPVKPGGSGESDKTEAEQRAKLEKAGVAAFLRGGDAGFRHEEQRGLVAGTITSGGSLIAPEQYLTEVLREAEAVQAIASLCRTINITSSLSLGVPTASGSSEAVPVGELETGSEITITTGKRELAPHAHAAYAKLSKKLAQVSAIPIESFVGNELGLAFGRGKERSIALGNGANTALGLFTASADGIPTSRDVSTGNTTTAVTFDGIIEALYSLKPVYRSRATILGSSTFVKNLRKIKDSDGQYIWVPAVTAGESDTIFGRKVVQSDYVPSTFTTGLYVGMIADFNYYWIVQVLALEIQKLVELFALTNQVGWLGRIEFDGMPVMPEAFSRIKLA